MSHSAVFIIPAADDAVSFAKEPVLLDISLSAGRALEDDGAAAAAREGGAGGAAAHQALSGRAKGASWRCRRRRPVSRAVDVVHRALARGMAPEAHGVAASPQRAEIWIKGSTGARVAQVSGRVYFGNPVFEGACIGKRRSREEVRNDEPFPAAASTASAGINGRQQVAAAAGSRFPLTRDLIQCRIRDTRHAPSNDPATTARLWIQALADGPGGLTSRTDVCSTVKCVKCALRSTFFIDLVRKELDEQTVTILPVVPPLSANLKRIYENNKSAKTPAT
ncbi:hypothetical protein MRX96_009708 [Rhipicephalus microplus]